MLNTIQAVIFDMDGVLWRGDMPLRGIPQIFEYLRFRQIPYVFATNNSARTPDDYVAKLGRMGIIAEPHHIITSGIATAHYLRQTYPHWRTAHILGKEGIRTAMQQQGFTLTTEQADCVVVGIDQQMTYADLRAAAYQIQRGAAFIGTNADVSYPEPEGFAPGAGSIIAALEAATGQTAQIIGKPHPPMFHAALAVLGTAPEYTLMVGDRMETDIVGAYQVGLKTALVLSGVTTEQAIDPRGVQPNMIVADVADLQAMWEDNIPR